VEKKQINKEQIAASMPPSGSEIPLVVVVAIEKRFPTHSKATCISGGVNSVLIGFEDETIAEWCFLTGQYLLRSIYRSVPIGLCYGKERTVFAVFKDTSVFKVDIDTGVILNCFNLNLMVDEDHQQQVDDANARRDDFGNPASAVDAGILESYPDYYSINRCHGSLNGQLLYSVCRSLRDSWGVWVLSQYTLLIWNGDDDDSQFLLSTEEKEFVGISERFDGQSILIATDQDLIRFDLASKNKKVFDQERYIIAISRVLKDGRLLLVTQSSIRVVEISAPDISKPLLSLSDNWISDAVVSGDGSQILFRNVHGQWSLFVYANLMSYPVYFSEEVDLIAAVPESSDRFIVVFCNHDLAICRLLLVEEPEEQDAPF